MSGSITLNTETAPFDTTAPKYANLMTNLQGNILTSHGRDFAVHTFFRFKPDVAAARAAITTLRQQGYINSAAEQAAQSSANQQVFGTLLLSAHGLTTLGLVLPANFGASANPAGPPPINVVFGPMKDAAAELGDAPATWEQPYQNDIHGLLIIAYGNHGLDDQAVVDTLFAEAQKARNILEGGATVLAVETGHTHIIENEPREQFGFVDGISQPLFRTKDITGPSQDFDPGAGLLNLVVKDPFAPAAAVDAFASFFVFRKLEQNVAGWRAAVTATAAALGVSPALAGGMAVGRFQNGDPIGQFPQPLGPDPQPQPFNDFTYAADVAGLRCPYHAHIRKANPRGDTDRNFGGGTGALNAGERNRRIARRGITYGDRAHDLSDAPSADVGLLFMCYQANIADQFGFMQKNWVNTNGFGRTEPVPGQDAVIGQGDHSQAQTWPLTWNGGATRQLPDFGKFVTNKGGEFFLAVSIATIESL